MLELLRGLSQSNKSVTARMDKMEQNVLNASTSNTRSQGHARYSVTATLGQGLSQPNTGMSDIPNYQVSQQLVHSSPQRAGHQPLLPTDLMQGNRPGNTFTQPFSSEARNDDIGPNIDVLRRIPSVSEAVKVLATYDS